MNMHGGSGTTDRQAQPPHPGPSGFASMTPVIAVKTTNHKTWPDMLKSNHVKDAASGGSGTASMR